ncbi:MAG: hypothetical protein AB7K24_15745 [Gemmataceae bacterium]
MLPANYRIDRVQAEHHAAIIDICRLVYPTETPYTLEELEDHRQVYPQGQLVALDRNTNEVAGVHLTLRLRLRDFHIDDSWDVLTAQGTFLDHDPDGHTLYGADLMVHPRHQHHGLGHGLTDAARFLVQAEKIWRMVGASRLPGYGKVRGAMKIDDYIAAVLAGQLFDPVLTIHLKDGWTLVRPIHGYLQHDEDSAGWAEVIQWLNPDCPAPEDVDLRRMG